MLSKRASRRLDRWIAQTHRWLGIAVCVFFVIWFASGLVMLYVNSPQLTRAEELAGLERIRWDRVAVSPGKALAAGGFDEFPQSLRLEMLAGEPYYRIAGRDGRAATISADTGELLGGVDPAIAEAVARRYAGPGSRPTWKGEVTSDQWTFEGRYDASRPFHVVRLNDAYRTELYVSTRTGQVVLDTNAVERFWNWPGEVLHLMEFAEFRQRELLWRYFMMTSTVVATIVAALGIWLGVKRIRVLTRYPRGNSVSPYRGVMKWHHVLGLLGSLALLAWIVGALVYLRPFGYLERQSLTAPMALRYAAPAGPRFPLELEKLRSAAPDGVRQVEFKWLHGAPFVVMALDVDNSLLFDAITAERSSLSEREIVAAAARLVEGGRVEKATLLTAPDEYWHTFRLTHRGLPMWRIEFDDAKRHWFHIDPSSGEITNMTTSGDRTFRWLFNGLHKFDFLFLVERPWLRDLVVLPLMILGLLTSGTGVIVGYRYVRRYAARR